MGCLSKPLTPPASRRTIGWPILLGTGCQSMLSRHRPDHQGTALLRPGPSETGRRDRRIPSARRSAVAGAVLAVALAGIALTIGLRNSDRGPVAPPLRAQHPAPVFTRPLAGLKAGTFSLVSQRGHPVLLSFLNTQATAGNDPSRAEIVFIKSMNTQNHPYGLRTVIVDAADAAGASPPGRDALANFTFDWALGPSIAVVGDEDGSLERAYGIRTSPTTFLIDKRGIIRRRWDGFALAAQLDFAIRPLVGRSIVGPGSEKNGG
jgi:peroxiredoxin